MKFAFFRGDGDRPSSSLWTVVVLAVETTRHAVGDWDPVSQLDPPPSEVNWCFALVMERRAGSGQVWNVVAFGMPYSVTNRVLAQLDVLRKWEEAETCKNDVYL